MARPRNPLPSYRFHKSSGQAIVTVYNPDGSPRDVLLGPYNSAESRARYSQICADLRPGNVFVDTVALTVAELVVPFLKHAIDYYGKGSELEAIRVALRVVVDEFETLPAAEFGPAALKAVRAVFVGKGWSRQYCNRQTRLVVRAFKWAVAEELIPVTVHTRLKTLEPLREGKTTAPEAPPRLPANPEHVAAALPFLPPHVRALVELIRATGMRPSEACRMTLERIDRAGAVWLFSPRKHKTQAKGKHRTVALGAAAQAVIVAYLDGKVIAADAPLFSPARQREERFARMRATRKTKVQPSQANRKKAKPKKVPGTWFRPAAICHAVKLACAKAKVPVWTPYQLRHLVAAELRERFSLEHVRAALGHSHASMSAHYAKGADLKLAEEVAAKAG